MQESDINILLKKYIDHNCSPEELSVVLKYIQLPEGKQALEDLLSKEWNAFVPEEALPGDSDLWFDRIEKKVVPEATVPFRLDNTWLKYAAILILTIGVGAWFMLQAPDSHPTEQLAMVDHYNPKGRRTQITLRDGSIVHLGADSRLRYPNHLKGNKRELFLDGEAFFEVKHDAKRPFVVHTGDVQTQVLGTSFKIKAFKNENISVAVATGKVSVGYKKQQSKLKSIAVLTPGEQVSWNAVTNRSVTTSSSLESIKGWKDGNLSFTDDRLDDISSDLERWYNTRILLKDPIIKTYSLSITVNGNAPITSALDAITMATGLKYSIARNIITLSKQ